METDSYLNYREIFLVLPVGVIIAKNRIMVDCNHAALQLFRASRDDIVEKLFSVLYPDRYDFEAAGRRMEPFLIGRVTHFDNRIMRRLDGTHFWATVRGYAFNPSNPHEMTAWVLTEVMDKDTQGQSPINLTSRERDVAALLLDRLTSKQIAKELKISPKTVDIHRASLLKKHSVKSTSKLIEILRT